MKKFGILIFIIALAVGLVLGNLFSFGKVSAGNLINISFGKGVRGSGNVTAEKRSVAAFEGIKVSGIFRVEAVAGREQSVEIEADDNLLPLITTEVRDGVLVIATKESIRPRSTLVVRVSNPMIARIQSSGVAKISATELSGPFELEMSGASKAELKGNVSELKVSVSGAAKIEATELQATNADIKASGACKVSVAVTGELNANASGASKIYYTGEPANIIRNTSGASRVKQM